MEKSYNWFPDELVSAGRENLDAAHVSRYDKKEDAGVAGELKILREFGLHSESVMVDIGCGTGQFTVAAAEVCNKVIAVDVSSVMMKRLESKTDESSLKNVELVHAGFLTYKHQGRPADFVYSRLALHHLPDFWKAMALERVRSFIQPGGIFRLWDVVYNFRPHEAEKRIEAWCAAAGSNIEEEWSRAELEEHVRDEHSTFSWIMEPVIEQCGFELLDTVYSADGIFGKYIARAV